MKIVSFLAAMFIRALNATLRVRHARVQNIVSTPQYILAFWHAHLLLMLHSRHRKPIAVMTSRSKDGDYMASVFDWYGGIDTARGSSTRGGGAALRELLRLSRAGKNIAFTPDGPKGPARVLKEGVIFAARASGLPIVPVIFAAKKKRLLRSWDRMIIPHPFSKAIFLYGDPMLVPRDGDVEEWRLKVEKAMNALTDEAENDFDQLWRNGDRD